jgi:hypothetical protein
MIAALYRCRAALFQPMPLNLAGATPDFPWPSDGKWWNDLPNMGTGRSNLEHATMLLKM